MSLLQDALKESEKVVAGELEKLLIAGLQDLAGQLPAQYQTLVVGIVGALEPAIKAFLDAQIAKI